MCFWRRCLWDANNDLVLQSQRWILSPRIDNLISYTARSHHCVKRRKTDFLHFLQKMLSRPVDHWMISAATQRISLWSSLLHCPSRAFGGEQTHWAIYQQRTRNLWGLSKHHHLFLRGNLWGITQWAQRLLTKESKPYWKQAMILFVEGIFGDDNYIPGMSS